MSKTGADHLKSLRDGREVFLNGERVADVTVHPAFRNACRSAAKLYDFQAANLDLMTFTSPTSGKPVNRCWQLPRNYDDLVSRRKALVGWSRTNYGFLGRSPDHISSSLCGQVMGIDVFKKHSEARAKALLDYYTFARDNDLFLTYVIINPQADRGKDTSQQQDEYLTTAVVDEDSAGITVRGAKMLGTSSIMANEVLVANIQPLQPGEEKYAISFALPMGTKGIKVLSRKSYEAAAPSVFDNPLSSTYDENDALIYFDDVKVPWERVFIYKDVNMARAQFQDTWAHAYQNYQCQVRLMVKLQFLMGIARKICETSGTMGIPSVRENLGKLAAYASMVEGMVYGMESGGTRFNDYFVPSRHLMYAAQVITQEMYPNIITAIRELAGGGVIMLPSSVKDFDNPELNRLIHKTQKSPTTDSMGRVKFLKLAWDAIGSEFASRHTQYEMFYAGAQFVTRSHMFRTFNWSNAMGLVDDLMGRYDVSGRTDDGPKRAPDAAAAQ